MQQEQQEQQEQKQQEVRIASRPTNIQEYFNPPVSIEVKPAISSLATPNFGEGLNANIKAYSAVRHLLNNEDSFDFFCHHFQIETQDAKDELKMALQARSEKLRLRLAFKGYRNVIPDGRFVFFDERSFLPFTFLLNGVDE
jgi:hypothetical protein